MSEMHRVQDKKTGDKFSVRYPDLEAVEVLDDEPAVDAYGTALPPEHAEQAPEANEPDETTPQTQGGKTTSGAKAAKSQEATA